MAAASDQTTETYRVACDVGGTFTDLAVLSSDGRLSVFKAPTTTGDQGLGGIDAAIGLAVDEMAAAGVDLPARTSVFVHATTRPLNAILQGQTASTAFITTRGHPDILFLREGGRTSFRRHIAYPRPYVPRRLTFELPERIGAQGDVLEALDEEAARAVLEDVAQAGVEAIAVCLLWSVVNPEHELLLARMIEEVLPGVPFSLSHRVNPIIREYRRASATAIDASLKPLISRYLGEFERCLRGRGFHAELLCASCTGTMLPVADVATAPIHTVQSGPALAPLAAVKVAARSDEAADSLIVLDVGGTSSDVTVVRGGALPLTSEFWLGARFSGHMLGLPAVDVQSIGAGGGSIAWLDSGGLLRVGPQSAGASPGPVCYGAGGVEPTVTDAALVLGYLNPEYFLGGRMELDAHAALDVIERRLAQPLEVDAVTAADAVLAVAVQQMTDAIEESTVSQGLDPREAVIVAGGGAAGFAIDAVARELGVSTVLVGRAAPALAAYGGSVSPLARDFRRSHMTSTATFDFAGVDAVLQALTHEAEAFLADRTDEPGTRELEWFVGARYGHQRWEVEVPLPEPRLHTDADVAALVERFHTAHERLYAIKDPNQLVEFITWRVRASHISPAARQSSARTGDISPPRTGTRMAYFRGHGRLDTPVIGGAALKPGRRLEGPLLVEEPATTIVVSPGSALEVGRSGELHLSVGTGVQHQRFSSPPQQVTRSR
ncbi:MAG: hydantoinase/oxoprolinase family protein [Solirubrobacteraceae bacterium]